MKAARRANNLFCLLYAEQNRVGPAINLPGQLGNFSLTYLPAATASIFAAGVATAFPLR